MLTPSVDTSLGQDPILLKSTPSRGVTESCISLKLFLRTLSLSAVRLPAHTPLIVQDINRDISLSCRTCMCGTPERSSIQQADPSNPFASCRSDVWVILN